MNDGHEPSLSLVVVVIWCKKNKESEIEWEWGRDQRGLTKRNEGKPVLNVEKASSGLQGLVMEALQERERERERKLLKYNAIVTIYMYMIILVIMLFYTTLTWLMWMILELGCVNWALVLFYIVWCKYSNDHVFIFEG